MPALLVAHSRKWSSNHAPSPRHSRQSAPPTPTELRLPRSLALQIIVVLGVLGGIGASRVVRGAVIAAKENVYFEAARAVGSSRWRTLLHHLLPNIAPVIIVIYSINIGAVVISEASLSFLGFGLPTTVPSWGGMLSREGRQYMEIAPRLAVWPGLCLTVVVYCLNMVGDAVRDLLDPRLRGGSGRLGAYGAQAVRKTGSTPPPSAT